jgi:myo-inositol catabolism protein IolC
MENARIDPRSTLHLAAFDHRQSLRRAIEAIAPGDADAARRVALKLLIWRGVGGRLDASRHAGVLVDPDAGAVIDAASADGAVTAMALEASGQRWLAADREATELVALLARHHPTYAKVLMRWHPADPADRRRAQLDVLRALTSIAADAGAALMLELLVPPEGADARLADADEDAYRSEVLPVRLADAVRQLADAGVSPELWKIDGLDRRGAATVVGHAVHETSGGRAGIVVLGAGRSVADIERWFAATSGVDGFCGFAIGRSIWWEPIRRHLLGELDADATAAAIGAAFAEIVAAYERATATARP